MSVINADNIIILFKLNPLSFVVFAKSILSDSHNRRNLDFRFWYSSPVSSNLVLKIVALARLASLFLLLSQKKETKEYPQGASPTSLSAKALSWL